MTWWIVAAYFTVALVLFIGFARLAEPLDLRAWLNVLLVSLFWPITAVAFTFG